MRTTLFATALAAGMAAGALADDSAPGDATLGQKPPEGAVVLFNGENLDGWVKAGGGQPAEWKVADGILMIVPGKGSIKTEKSFGDFQLHIEFNLPYMPKARGQGRGNSGVYLDGTYELQVLDSYGLKSRNNDCGAIYQQIVPAVNACKPPLQWQSYDVTFRKARVEDGKVVKKARITVLQNGVKIIDDAEISTTPGGVGTKEGEDGPLMLQDHHNEVQFRNIWLKPAD